MLSRAERHLLLATRDTLHAALTRYGKPARTFSLIHADLHPRNVLIDGTHAAVIDFDDAGFGWHQYDLAVALVSYQHHPAFAAFRDACIAGYRSVRALADAGPRLAADVPADPRHGADRLVPSAPGTAALGRPAAAQ